MAFIVLFSLLSLIFGYDEAEIVFAGDAMMHQAQLDAAKHSDSSYDFSEYFEAVTPYIATADYAVVNLETPISNPPYSGYPCFNAPDSYLDALSNAGFDLYLMANNHVLDRRDKGLKNTIAALDQRNLNHIGAYTDTTHRTISIPMVKTINGIKVGFLNYTYGTNGFTPICEVIVDYIDKDLIRRDVETSRLAGAEIIVACVHWGVEYQMFPHPSQKSLAEYLRSLGIEVIIGGHPHVVQPMELTQDSSNNSFLMVYSLGNLISNMKTRDTRGGALLRLTLRREYDGKVRVADVSYKLVYTEPANSAHNFRLVWADDSDDPRADAFANYARKVLNEQNNNVREK